MPDDNYGIEAIDPRAFMEQYIRMVKAMLDNSLLLMEDEAQYHFATQMGCIASSVFAVMGAAPDDVKAAFEAANEIFNAATVQKQDEVDVVHMSEEGATSFKVVVGGDLGRSMKLEVECRRCGKTVAMDPLHYGFAEIHACITN